MSWNRWLKNILATLTPASKRSALRKPRTLPTLEALEDRWVPSDFLGFLQGTNSEGNPVVLKFFRDTDTVGNPVFVVPSTNTTAGNLRLNQANSPITLDIRPLVTVFVTGAQLSNGAIAGGSFNSDFVPASSSAGIAASFQGSTDGETGTLTYTVKDVFPDPDRTFSETIRLTAPRDDVSIRLDEPGAGFIGANQQVGAVGDDQAVDLGLVAPGQFKRFVVRITNNGEFPDELMFKVAGVPRGWTIQTSIPLGDRNLPVLRRIFQTSPDGGLFFDTSGTVAVNAVPPGESVEMVVEIGPNDFPSGVDPEAVISFTTFRNSPQDVRDQIKIRLAVADVVPDLLVARSNQPAFVGDNRYEQFASPLQTLATTTDGRAVTYQLRLQNDGTQAGPFRLSDAGFGNDANFTVDYRVNGVLNDDIKTFAGLITDSIPVGGSLDFSMTVTPRPNLPRGTKLVVPISVFKDANDSTVRDQVLVETTVDLFPDLLIKRTHEDEALLAGDNLLEDAPIEDQTSRGTILVIQPVFYDVFVQNDNPDRTADPASFVVKEGRSSNPNFEQFYKFNGADVTAAVRGTGFLVRDVAPGTAKVLTMEVRPVPFVSLPAIGTVHDAIVEVLEGLGSPNEIDSVKATTTVGLIVNTISDKIDRNEFRDGVLDVEPDIAGDQISLRAALDFVNTRPLDPTIHFNIPDFGTAIPVINIVGALPLVTARVTIDGRTQPGAGIVELNGAATTVEGSNGLVLQSSAFVSGLFIRKFNSAGIEVDGGALTSQVLVGDNVLSENEVGVRIRSGFATLEGNRIGTNRGGTEALANFTGVEILGGSVEVGNANRGNLISGNTGAAIRIESAADTLIEIEDNKIGTNLAGTDEIPNGRGIGVHQASNTVIVDNIISGNRTEAILLEPLAPDTKVNNTTILRNNLGFAANRSTKLPNQDGIALVGDVNFTQIGEPGDDGQPPRNGNLIGGNSRHGIRRVATDNDAAFIGDNDIILNGGNGIDMGSSTSLTGTLLVQGNRIGTNALGADLGNSGDGINVRNHLEVGIGGVASVPAGAFADSVLRGAPNVIAFNRRGIVTGEGGTFQESAAILSNSVFSNDAEGIVTANSLADVPNPPTLIRAASSDTGTVLLGTFDTPAFLGTSRAMLLQFFANPTGENEGRIFLGTHLVKGVRPNLQGLSFLARLPVSVAANTTVTATVQLLDLLSLRNGLDGDTSAFSSAIPTTGGLPDDDADGIPNIAEPPAAQTQANVVAIPVGQTGDQTDFFTLSGPPENPPTNAQFSSIVDSQVQGLPPNVQATHGFLEFDVIPNPNGTAEVELEIPAGSANRFVKLKRDPVTKEVDIVRDEGGRIKFFDFDAAKQLGALSKLDPITRAVAGATLMLKDNDFGDFNSADGIISDPLLPVLVPETDVGLTVAGPSSGSITQALTYTFTARNNGTQPADDVEIQVVLPAGCDFISGGVFDPVTRTVLIGVGDLEASAAAERSLVVRANTVGTTTLTGTVAIRGVALDTDAANDAVAQDVVVNGSALNAQLVGRKLIVAGTAFADGFELALERKQVMLTPLPGTVIDGDTQPVVFTNVGSVKVQTDAGDDTIRVVGRRFKGRIVLNGGVGDDRYVIGSRGATIVVKDPDGKDRVGFSLADVGVVVDLRLDQGQTQRIDVTGNTLSLQGKIERATGSPYGDTIVGEQGTHRMIGGGGADQLFLLPPRTPGFLFGLPLDILDRWFAELRPGQR